MKIVLPENLKGKELLQYLYSNKTTLKSQKKTGLKFADPFSGVLAGASPTAKALDAVKVQKAEMPGTEYPPLIVDVIANLSGWMDSDDDVILRGAYSKSIADKGNNFPFLKDHVYRTDFIIAETLEVKAVDIQPAQLGIVTNATVIPQALMFKGRVTKDISGMGIYSKYRNKLIKQHSIGLWYVTLELAMNDPDFEDEFKVWNKYRNQVLNMGKAEEYGYFWAVPEIQLIENSAVVFGANSQTPTLSVEEEAKSSTLEQQLSGALERYYGILGAALGTPQQQQATANTDANSSAAPSTDQRKEFSHFNLF